MCLAGPNGLFFGRAGHINVSDNLNGTSNSILYFGHASFPWASVTRMANHGYNLQLWSTNITVNVSGNYTFPISLRCLVNNTVGRGRSGSDLLFFGRAGDEDLGSGYHQFRNIGAISRQWSSVTSKTTNGYHIDFDAVEVDPSYSDSRAYGFPLRCLVNNTVGGAGRNFGRAGYEVPSSSYRQPRDVGVGDRCWSSVPSTSSSGYQLSFDAVDVIPYRSASRANGYSLRCLVNNTVGGGEL